MGVQIQIQVYLKQSLSFKISTELVNIFRKMKVRLDLLNRIFHIRFTVTYFPIFIYMSLQATTTHDVRNIPTLIPPLTGSLTRPR